MALSFRRGVRSLPWGLAGLGWLAIAAAALPTTAAQTVCRCHDHASMASQSGDATCIILETQRSCRLAVMSITGVADAAARTASPIGAAFARLQAAGLPGDPMTTIRTAAAKPPEDWSVEEVAAVPILLWAGHADSALTPWLLDLNARLRADGDQARQAFAGTAEPLTLPVPARGPQAEGRLHLGAGCLAFVSDGLSALVRLPAAPGDRPCGP